MTTTCGGSGPRLEQHHPAAARIAWNLARVYWQPVMFFGGQLVALAGATATVARLTV